MLLLPVKKKVLNWTPWFAWRPVITRDGLVWLEYVLYKGAYDYAGLICWFYKRKQNEVAKE